MQRALAEHMARIGWKCNRFVLLTFGFLGRFYAHMHAIIFTCRKLKLKSLDKILTKPNLKIDKGYYLLSRVDKNSRC